MPKDQAPCSAVMIQHYSDVIMARRAAVRKRRDSVLTTCMAHVAGHLASSGLAGIVEIMALWLQANRSADRNFKLRIVA